MTVCALVPIKKFAVAKTRLRAVLSIDEASFLAHQLALAAITVLTNSPSVQRVVLLGELRSLEKIADEFDCELASEDPTCGLSANLSAAGNSRGLSSSDTLAVFPTDTPFVGRADVEKIISRHRRGLTLCPAALDGGTNGLLITPPNAIEFHYGENSALLHERAARAAGLPVQIVDSCAFSRDIDTPEDLEWMCRNLPGGRLFDALHSSGIMTKALDIRTALSA